MDVRAVRAPASVPEILRTVVALLLGTILMVAGNAMLGTVVAVRATVEDFGTHLTGVVMAAYSAGFILGTLVGPHLIGRVGHIRTFAACSAVASAVAVAFPLQVDPVTWTALRAVMGFCLASVYMVIESWFNGASTDATRGRLFSIYMIANLASLSGGQTLLYVATPREFVLFAIGSLLLSLSIVPVSLTRTAAPTPPPLAPVSLRRLLAISPLALVGSVSAGFTLGAVGAMAPVYLKSLGLEAGDVATFMAALFLGGLVLQWPIGWLSDRVGRRGVLIAIAAALGMLCAFMAALDTASSSGLWALAALFGALAYPIYSLSVALANDRIEHSEVVAASAGLLLVCGAGSVVGPLLCGLAMSAFGAQAMFLLVAAAQAGLCAFALYRVSRRPPVPREAQAPFVVVTSSTSPAALATDPRPANGAAEAPRKPEAVAS
jgi:MFS family permease